MNNLIKSFTITLLIFLPLEVFGVTIVDVDGIYYSIYAGTATVVTKTDGSKYSGNITIPDEISYKSGTYVVNSIGPEAFKECNEVTSIKLPNTIKSIGSFYGCSKLKNIVLPELVTRIPERAFFKCTSLESIVIDRLLTSVGAEAFSYCDELKSVYISDLEAWCKISFNSVTSNPLGRNADLYLNGYKVENLVIPETIPVIKEYAFQGCTSIKSVEISESTKVYDWAFSGNKNLTTLYSHSTVMNDYCFSGCTSLNTAFLYNTIGGNNCFYQCPNLETVLLPKSIVESDQYYSSDQRGYLYKMFPNVKEYILQDGITKIGKSKFIDCSTAERINIPSTVKLMCNMAFARCSNLKQVYIEDLQAWCGITYGQNNSDPGGGKDADPREANPLHVGADLYVDGEKLVNCVIPDQITQLNSAAFYGCSSIKSLTIGDNVSKIDNYAFLGCSNLSHVILPNNPIEFGREVFYKCENLTSAGPLKSNCSIEYGWIKQMPSWALSDISNLQTIIIPSTMESIGNYAFSKINYGELPIESIYIDAITPPSISSSTFSNYDATLFVPGGTYSSYSTANYWKKFNIVELIYIDNVCFADERIDMIAGESKKLDVNITPSNATYQKMYWHSLDSKIADVDENGVVTAIKTGNTRVSASTTDGTELTIYCDVHVTNPVSQVLLNKSTISIEVGQIAELTATCYPENADDNTIVWISDDNTIATVDKGKVIGKKLGKTIIKACSVNGIEATCSVNVVPTLATSISLNESSINLNTGESLQLIADVLPAKATIKDVSWNSDDNKVADVDDAGKVTAISNGSTYITAKTKDGTALSAKCKVTVTTLAKHIELNKNSCDLIVGEGTQLLASISPSTTSNQEVSWKSSDENVASVSVNGFVKAVSTGRASIIATTTDGTNLEIACLINVTNPVQSVSLNKTYAEIRVGEKLQLSATCFPSNADDKTITWYTGDSSVATVENGVVIGKSLGITTIQANSVNGKEAKCTISVVPTRVANVSLDKTELILNANDTYQLTARVTPVDATNATLVWGSSNDRVATVNGEGIITAITSGTATITASTTDGTKISATCIVTVKTPVTSIFVNPDKLELLIGDQMKLTAACKPSNADNTEVMWRSSNESVADVLAGYVTGKSAGEAIITATTTDGTELSCEVHITVKKHPQTIEWNQDISSICYGGELIELRAVASSGLPIVFTSSDDNVVSIFNMGNAIYLNPGECGSSTITATQVGNYYYESTSVIKEVKVIDPNEIRNVSSDNKYIVYSINGILVGRFTEKEFEMFLKQKSLKGLYIVNGKKITIN